MLVLHTNSPHPSPTGHLVFLDIGALDGIRDVMLYSADKEDDIKEYIKATYSGRVRKAFRAWFQHNRGNSQQIENVFLIVTDNDEVDILIKAEQQDGKA